MATISAVTGNIPDEKPKYLVTSINTQRVNVHYLAAIGLYALYGGQVCPFLDDLGFLHVAAPLVPVLIFTYFIRTFWYKKYIATYPAEKQTALIFRMDWLLLIIAGSTVGFLNSLFYDTPFESGVRVVAGLFAVGFYIACDLSLQFERVLGKNLVSKGIQLPSNGSYFPLTKKFTLVAVLSVVIFAVIIMFIVVKDLEWLISDGSRIPEALAIKYILIELSFTSTVILCYLALIILSYSKNLNILINQEKDTLSQVTRGALDVAVPVTSNDEFGVIAQHTNTMIERLQSTNRQITHTRDVAIMGLAALAEARDNETGAHILRTQRYVKVLAEYLSQFDEHKDYLTEDVITLLYKSAPLHDVGKVGIPDAILLKPGKLTDDEFTVMKRHPQIGYDALLQAEKDKHGTGEDNTFLHFAREIALTHHEKWDGSGYPKGLKEKDIPLPGRLMALADVYDALISKRVYKPAFSHEKAKAIIVEGKGSHFDPKIVEAFLACEDMFKGVAEKFSD